MKKILLVLLISVFTFVSCSDDEESVEYNETMGYLINLTSVKHGIVGLWESITGGTLYFKYTSDGQICSGYSRENLTDCTLYEVVNENGKYYMRRYYVGLNNEQLYDDFEILLLNKINIQYLYKGSIITEKRIAE
jgi:hypothetical protein